MYSKQVIEAGGILWEEYGCEPEIPEPKPSDIYQRGIEDGEECVPPTLPESDEYWDGYSDSLRNYWLRLQGKEVIQEM